MKYNSNNNSPRFSAWRFWMGFFLLSALVFLLLFQLIDQNYPWLTGYFFDRMQRHSVTAPKGTRHIFLLTVDHYQTDDAERLNQWLETLPKLATDHRDADGKSPQITWFYNTATPDSVESLQTVQKLSQLAYDGLGEIELNVPHQNESDEEFQIKLNAGVELLQKTGAATTREARPRAAFGFVHSLEKGVGDLANCKVPHELLSLRRSGSFAEFTLPYQYHNPSNFLNRFFYAVNDSTVSNVYEKGERVRVGKPALGDLFIYSGQSVVTFSGLVPQYDYGRVSEKDIVTPERVHRWIENAVYVEGQPKWLFVKVFSQNTMPEQMLGANAHQKLFEILETQFNDGKEYVLHYVTAREAYNIAKAAENGHKDDPNQFRNYIIPPYVNRSLIASAPFEILSYDENQAVLRFLADKDSYANIKIRGVWQINVEGRATLIQKKEGDQESLIMLRLKDHPLVGLSFSSKPRSKN